MYASTLTQQGQEYIAKCIANASPLSFVKVKIGDGTLLSTEDPSLFTDIKSLKKEVPVSSVVASGNSALFTAQVDNTGVTTGYRATEIGIYVNDEGTEKLFWYVNQDIEASFLPPADRGYTAFEKAINIIVDSLDTVILNWDGSQLWASKQELIETMVKTIERITGCSYGGYIQDTVTVASGYVYLDKTMTAENIFYCYASGTNNYLNNADYLVDFTNKYLYERLATADSIRAIPCTLLNSTVVNNATLERYGKVGILRMQLANIGSTVISTVTDVIQFPSGTKTRGFLERDTNVNIYLPSALDAKVQILTYNGQNQQLNRTIAFFFDD